MSSDHAASAQFDDDPFRVAVFLAIDPVGLGGVRLRARPGEARDQWFSFLESKLPDSCSLRRIPLNTDDARLLGGLDLAGTLASGRPIRERGLLAQCDGGIAVLAMAERIEGAFAAKVAAVVDRQVALAERDGVTHLDQAAFGMVLCDEGIERDEGPAASLLDRVAFHVDLPDRMPQRKTDTLYPRPDEMALARKLARKICASDEVIKALATAAMSLGVQSVRALHFALKVARINAALRGRDAVDAIDAALAVRLVLAPRATRLPSPPEEDLETESEHTEAKAGDADEDRSCPRDPPNETLEDSVLAAARVAIPPKLLEQLLSSNRPLRAQGGGTSGARQSDAKRGRRIGIRRGPNRSGRGLNVLATLRAAVPWQRLRTGAVTPHQKPSPSRDAIRILPEDFRLHRYQQRSDTLSIFVVDASGSQALHRLGEAKGAVELLLADCYVRRDRVAVIAFRGRDAQVLLPPTRSLARAKKSLAGLPGGGGTPLASGLDAAGLMVEAAHRRGETALVVLLTDGRANVARNGAGGRMQAEADALHAAHQMRQSAVASLVIDTSASGQAQAEAVAHAMNARYLPLPHADAHVMSRAVSTLVRERSERS